MKMVVAVIKPFKLEEVREALTSLGVQGLTVSEVKGFGRQKRRTEIYRGADDATSFIPQLKLEIATGAGEVEEVVEAIQRTGRIGDGKIFVFDLQDAVRIRTGEEGESVLQAHDAEEVLDGNRA